MTAPGGSLRPCEAAAVLGVTPSHLARLGLTAHRTPGGHRRYDPAEVFALRQNSRCPDARRR